MYRRAGFGLAPGQLDDLEALGVDTVVDRMVDPSAHGVPAGPDDLWADLDFPFQDTGEAAVMAVDRWMDHLIAAPRTFEEWMAWYWHGHLVSSVSVVAFLPMMTTQMNLFRREGLGSFRRLLRDVTVDPAMLRYLDGGKSTGQSPNENYARELLELFSLGIGAYTEADVAAGALALTGWVVSLTGEGTPDAPFGGTARFDPARHDDTAQHYLGHRGVHDVDTVIDAIVAQEACADFVAGRFGRAVLGDDADPQLLAGLARQFRDTDLDLRVLARGVLEAVAEGRVSGLVLGPLPWLLSAQRATGATLDGHERYWTLYDADHLPMWPPNVGGWPGGRTWLASSTTAQRYNLAVAVAAAAPEDNGARRAALTGDLDALADALGRPEGFSESTRGALSDLAPDAPRDDGTALLAVALAAPDLIIA